MPDTAGITSMLGYFHSSNVLYIFPHHHPYGTYVRVRNTKKKCLFNLMRNAPCTMHPSYLVPASYVPHLLRITYSLLCDVDLKSARYLAGSALCPPLRPDLPPFRAVSPPRVGGSSRVVKPSRSGFLSVPSPGPASLTTICTHPHSNAPIRRAHTILSCKEEAVSQRGHHVL